MCQNPFDLGSIEKRECDSAELRDLGEFAAIFADGDMLLALVGLSSQSADSVAVSFDQGYRQVI